MAKQAAAKHAGEGWRPSRRTLLIGGGAGLGLLVAWAVWPRAYSPNLTADAGESVYGAWIKIGTDGHVTVAVPQSEQGQGVFTAFAQIIADELGADWKKVGVEAAPLNPLYANPLGAATVFETALGALPEWLRERQVVRSALMLTGGSSSIRQFEPELRAAGAAARAMLCMAAARRWGVDWKACDTVASQVVSGGQRLGFGALAEDAADETPPEEPPLRTGTANRLTGQRVARLDAPAKVDGSLNYAADVRLPGMVFAAVRQGPAGDTALLTADEALAKAVPGVLSIVRGDRWVAAVANTWWAAERALAKMRPAFRTPAERIDNVSLEEALAKALDGAGTRIVQTGDLAADFRGARVVSAEYSAGLALHAALEPMTCTAAIREGRLSLWLPTQAPSLARAAAAAAIGMGQDQVTVHPMMAGGSFGAKLETEVAAQAAAITRAVGRPVQLTWSRAEDARQDRYRAPAAARLTAKLGAGGAITGWLAKIAAPSTGRELAARLLGGDPLVAGALALSGGDRAAVAGAAPAYAIPNLAVDHHPADIGVPTGYWRSGAHSYTAFFTESFIDELSHIANIEALSFRMGKLGNEARLARCLQTAAAIGGWQGGTAGSGQGIACHSFRGSHIAVMAEAALAPGRRVKVTRLVAAVDCGRVINPDLVLQQIEGGLIFGMAAAIGCSTGFEGNLAEATSIADLNLPTLADAPDITVELIDSAADPGGVSELAVPPVAPAIANAIQASSGVRLRRLPLLSDVG
ncbi:molybdopterin cofactor-binding domain-containing protein [Sphingomonas canadensis]|uniref:Molybdopterin cofactor-binding domain-containing protein n=1 Tax=Sphingomonas canadensis TaxID=1219257 RepID=A0ABW3H8W1_9SPHN|nr:molybdopterin cofactor-binding domain-containing protein [Sphingomonas canadensis]MCW3837155.1 molybdopterin-dependent oxidoreductase [Sphingomonas canadensis]